MATWLECRDVTCAFIREAIVISRAGGMARSSLATMYQFGLLLQAGVAIVVPNACPASGPCVAVRITCSRGLTSWAKSWAGVYAHRPELGRTHARSGAEQIGRAHV